MVEPVALHRVEIVPYDALAERANAVLANVERYLLKAGAEPPNVPMEGASLASRSES